MDKFVVSFPRGNSQSKQKVGSKRPVTNSASELKEKFSKLITVSGTGTGSSREHVRSRREPTQAFLDLGQASFGAHTSCSTCSMFYVIGDVDDELRHKAFCVKSREALTLPNLKSFHVVESATADSGDSIVEVRWHERHRLAQEPLRSIMDAVQRDLGSTLTLMKDDDSANKESVLLFVRAKKVIGCVVREEVEAAKLVRLSAGKGSADVDIALTGPRDANDQERVPVAVRHESIDVSGSPSATTIATATTASAESSQEAVVADELLPHGVTMGIKLIWVYNKNRREGIASRMLDAARKSFEFGRIIKKVHVAYSQPTDEGLRLFLSYAKREHIWGYC
jgi:hypothetical protein